MARALADPLTLLLLLLFLLAAVYVFTHVYIVEYATPSNVARVGEIACRAGPLRVSATVYARPDGGVVAVIRIQPPNPCYNITYITSQYEYHANRTLDITVRVYYHEPQPGTMCIQLLPPPTRYTLATPPLPSTPTLIRFKLTAIPPSGREYTCTTNLTLKP